MESLSIICWNALFDPLELAHRTEKIVTKGILRKYYRFRPATFYGGISTADCVGCALRCVFCWSGLPRDFPERSGRYYSPEQVSEELMLIAEKRGYGQLRVSGNEPTIGKEHLLKLLELVDETDYEFILETSGVLINKEYADQLSRSRNLHVRICLKGTCKEEFSVLTGSVPEGFELQLEALENLLDAGVSTHIAVMKSFSCEENFERLILRLREIKSSLYVEEEYVTLYPLVIERLKTAGIKPFVAYDRSGRSCKLP